MAKASKIIFGKFGDDLAVVWLADKGFEILHRNWRSGRYETDIIAAKEGILHFIEVKTRRSGSFGNPEDQVNRAKLKNMIAAGTHYIELHNEWKRIRFDILAIRIQRGGTPEYLLIEDVYL